MPLPRNGDTRPRLELGAAGKSQDPWEVIAELRTLASLTAGIAEALSRSFSLREGLDLCVNALVHGLEAAFARIWTLNEKDNVLELQASAGLYTHLDGPHSRVPVGQFKIGLIAQERKPHLTNAVIGDPCISDQEWARREGMIAFAGYPLICSAHRLVGVMALFARHPLTLATLHALATVADSIAHGIDHWRAVEDVRASEERFALAVRGTEEGIWDWNVLTNEVYLAPRFKELLGYEAQEVESSYAMWESRLHPEDHDRVLQALQQHLEQRHPYQVDYRLRTKFGNYRWFHARGQASWDDAGRPVRMVGSISYIKERKLLEMALREGEERYRTVVNNVADAIITIDEHASIQFVNQAAAKLFGYRMEEMLGQNVKILMPEPFHSEHDGYIANYLRTGKSKVIGKVREVSGLHRNGTTFPIELKVSQYFRGDRCQFVASIRDLTWRKLSEQRSGAIHQVTQILTEETELTASLSRILLALCEHFNWSVGEYWIRDQEADVLRLAMFRHPSFVSVPHFQAASSHRTFARGVGLPGRTWASARPEWIADVTKDTNFPRAAAAAQDNLHGAVSLPILIRGEVHGVMEFFKSEIQKPDEELLRTLLDIAHQISRYLDLQQEQQQTHRHQQELTIARRIQQHMFPKSAPVLEGIEIAGASQPATATGGDYFDFIPSLNNRLLLALGDVSGHGLGAALVVAAARAYLRALAVTVIPIEAVINFCNDKLVEDMAEEFMTLFLGQIDPSSRSLTYCSAGHCPGIIFDCRGEVRATLPPLDLPLGIESHHTYQKSAAVQLLPADLLLVISDGILEAFAPDREVFGMTRVLNTVRVARHLPPAEIITNLFSTVREFVQGEPHDDMTAIVAKVVEGM